MILSPGCVRLENGRCPFLDGLEELTPADQAKVLAWAKRLAAHEELRRPPFAKHLDDGIFELRFPCGPGSIARSFSIAGEIV
jgi:tRNA (Thr-GGU) A37 N-methylase